MIIEQSLEAAKTNLETAYEHAADDQITIKIKRLNRRLEKCDQTPPPHTYLVTVKFLGLKLRTFAKKTQADT